MIAASLIAAPASAASWQDQSAAVHPGAFVGGQLKLSLGGGFAPKPRAELAVAPTQSRISEMGFVRTRIGDGFGLSLPHSKPSLTMAGIRADTALKLKSGGKAEDGQKLRLGPAGAIAIGVGAAVVGLLASGVFVRESEKGAD
jgi:hypothetical protein